jgi:hypothetical protein
MKLLMKSEMGDSGNSGRQDRALLPLTSSEIKARAQIRIEEAALSQQSYQNFFANLRTSESSQSASAPEPGSSKLGSPIELRSQNVPNLPLLPPARIVHAPRSYENFFASLKSSPRLTSVAATVSPTDRFGAENVPPIPSTLNFGLPTPQSPGFEYPDIMDTLPNFGEARIAAEDAFQIPKHPATQKTRKTYTIPNSHLGFRLTKNSK